MLLSCGIRAQRPVLAMPVYESRSDIDDIFQFRATEANGGGDENPYFRGFEIYYKFFSNDLNGQTLLTSQSGYTTLSELTMQFFKRVSYYIGDENCDKTNRIFKPLIKVPPAFRGYSTDIIITIDFSDLTDVYIQAAPEEDYIYLPEPTPAAAEVQLPVRRGIEDSENQYYFKGFDSYKTTDSDMNGVVTLEQNQSASILLYVLSFGIDDNFEELHSTALCLGSIILEDLNLIDE